MNFGLFFREQNFSTTRYLAHFLGDRCLSVCVTCNIDVLWHTGWMDHDATWYGHRIRPRPHCVRRGPSSPAEKGTAAPNFSVNVYCGQTVRWIKMPLGTEVGLGSDHIVLYGNTAPQKGHSTPIFGPCLLWPNRLRCHLVDLAQAALC